MARKSQKSSFAIAPRDLDHILRAAANDLEALRGQSLFITGGTGFFGKWLLAGLLFASDELSLDLKFTVLSRNPSRFQQEFPDEVNRVDLRFLGGDVVSFPGKSRRFDYLIHAATDTTSSDGAGDEQQRLDTITQGTRNMLALARESGARRFLNISSGAVYGEFARQLAGAREDDYLLADPLTTYAQAKRDAEQLCEDSGADFVTARCFAFLGPHLPLDAHFAAGNFLRDAHRGGPILIRGDGTALRSYLYPADLVVWLLRILVRGQRGRAYNVGSDEVVTLAQLAHHIATAVQPAEEVMIQSQEPFGPQNIYLPNIARASTELNLDVTISLRDAIARTMEFFQSSAGVA